MLKILHCADLHLDSPFSGETPQIREMRRNELRAAFANLMMYARNQGVQLLLIAGDLFDSVTPSSQTVDLVQKEFAEATARGMRIVLSPGNHDPYVRGSVWETMILPEGVHLFCSERLAKVEFPDLNACVYGYAFTSPELLHCPFDGEAAVDADPFKIQILCAHGELYKSSSPYCPITLPDLRSSGFDYAALGHVHKGGELHKEGNTYYAYSGCLEGRDFGEEGPKGAIIALLDKEDGVFRMQAKFLRFSLRRYESLEISVRGLESTEAVAELLKKQVREQGYGEDTILRITAVGEASPSLKIGEGCLHGVRDRLCYVELRDQTVPLTDLAALADDPTIRGAFYEALLPVFREGTPAEKEIAKKALRFGLAALSGSDIIEF